MEGPEGGVHRSFYQLPPAAGTAAASGAAARPGRSSDPEALRQYVRQQTVGRDSSFLGPYGANRGEEPRVWGRPNVAKFGMYLCSCVTFACFETVFAFVCTSSDYHLYVRRQLEHCISGNALPDATDSSAREVVSNLDSRAAYMARENVICQVWY